MNKWLYYTTDISRLALQLTALTPSTDLSHDVTWIWLAFDWLGKKYWQEGVLTPVNYEKGRLRILRSHSLSLYLIGEWVKWFKYLAQRTPLQGVQNLGFDKDKIPHFYFLLKFGPWKAIYTSITSNQLYNYMSTCNKLMNWKLKLTVSNNHTHHLNITWSSCTPKLYAPALLFSYPKCTHFQVLARLQDTCLVGFCFSGYS